MKRRCRERGGDAVRRKRGAAGLVLDDGAVVGGLYQLHSSQHSCLPKNTKKDKLMRNLVVWSTAMPDFAKVLGISDAFSLTISNEEKANTSRKLLHDFERRKGKWNSEHC